jgi:hypothetical protein
VHSPPEPTHLLNPRYAASLHAEPAPAVASRRRMRPAVRRLGRWLLGWQAAGVAPVYSHSLEREVSRTFTRVR